MKTLAYTLLFTTLSSLPLMGMDSKDPLSSLPLTGIGSKDHQEKMDRWNQILDMSSRSGKSFRRDRTLESKGITLERDLTTILTEAGQGAGWDEKNRQNLHGILFPYCTHRSIDWKDGRTIWAQGGGRFLKGAGTGSVISQLTEMNNEKLTLVLEAFHGRATPEDWHDKLNIHYLTALMNLDTNQIRTVAGVLQLVKPEIYLHDDERGGYAHAVRYFLSLTTEQTPAVERLIRYFAESEDTKGKKGKNKTREIPDLSYLIPPFQGLELDHTNIIIDTLLSIPLLRSWNHWDISKAIEDLAHQDVEALRSTTAVQDLIGSHKDWTPKARTRLTERFASMTPELRGTIITAVKIIDPKKQLEPYDLNHHLDILEAFPNPQDMVSLIQICAKIGITPDAIISLLNGHKYHSREDFLYLLENMKFQIADYEGTTICEFFALLPRELWEDQLDRLHEEKKKPVKKVTEKKGTPEESLRLRHSLLAQRFLRFFDTRKLLTLQEYAAQNLTKAYWGTLLQSEQSERRDCLSTLILDHPKEMAIDTEKDDGLFHKAIDAVSNMLRSTYEHQMAYRALVKAKRAAFSFADVQCPNQTIAGIPVCLNAPYMPELGRLMARDLSSSLNITHAQFMGCVAEMNAEALKVTSLKDWFQDERVRQFFEGERCLENVGYAWFLFENFRHNPAHSFEARFNIFMRDMGFREFLCQYARGELKPHDSYTVKYQDCDYTTWISDLDKVKVKVKLQNWTYLESPEFQDLFVSNDTNIIGAQFRCILRHLQDQDNMPPASGGLSDRSREMLDLVKSLGEEVPFTYIQRRYLALKTGQKLQALNAKTVDAFQEAFCEVMLNLLDKEGPFVTPMPNKFGSTMHSTMPYYYNELFGPHLGLISSCPNRTYNESHCQIAIYHRWDSKLSVSQALQKFYALLTPEYVVAKIRERMIRYAQGSAEELTDEMLVNKLIEAKIFEAFQANSLPG
jgi:hypothetical protein